jgi:HPt (histidine-containing phosphotransfer) domain-containing protein
MQKTSQSRKSPSASPGTEQVHASDAKNGHDSGGSVKSLEQHLDDIASVLLMLDATDLPAVASLHDQFLNLHKALLTEAPALAADAHSCADVLEKIIMRDVKDVTAAVNTLTDDVTKLQTAIRDSQFPQAGTAAVARPAENVNAASPISIRMTDVVAQSVPTLGDKPKPPVPTAVRPAEKLTMSFANADVSLVGEFINEAKDHCLTAEQKMMDLETGADYEATINAIFRSFHTIKGAAGFLEMYPVSVLAHESETLLDMIRKGSMTIDGPVADLIFASIDGLRKLLAGAQDGLASGDMV